MRRKTIASRLYLLGALTLLSVATLAAGTVYCAIGTRHLADTLHQSGTVKAIEAGELELLLEKHRRTIGVAPLKIDVEELRRDRRSVAETRERIEFIAGRASEEFASSIKPMLPALWRSGEAILRLAESSAAKPDLEILSQYAAHAERVQDLIRQYRGMRVHTAHESAQAMSGRARSFVQWTTGGACLVLLLIGSLGYIVLRGMVSRLGQVTADMRQLALLDTNVDMARNTSADEIGEMATAVSVFKQNAAQLQQLSRWLDIALNNMARGISMFDASRRLVVCNGVYANLYNLPEALTRPGAAFADILRHRAKLVASVDGHEPEGPDGLAPALLELVEGYGEGQRRQRMRNGRTIEVCVKPLPWGGWVALHEDVTDRLMAAERIARLARQDALTGLANRSYFREGLEEATAGLEAAGSFALLAIDLDRFKWVNDTLGHPAGDVLLTIVGHRLSKLARRGDMVARLDGNEFAIIQRDLRERGDADALARRIVDVLHQPFMVHGKRVEIGGTVGIALAPRDGRTAEELMRKADIALYRAKSAGKGTSRFYDPEMEGRMRARRELECDLAGAAGRGELDLFYQPIVSLASRRVEGCEALIRWRHPLRGMISPAEFIPIAEETRLICEIGAWALGEACKVAATWPRDLSVAVNLSVAQFAGPDLALAAARALEESGLDAERLVLEVTETLLLGDDPATFDLLHRLRDLGVAIALDDFGTGYSSLSHLRGFPFDKIKIDQSFVRDLPQRKNCEAIVGAVARLASCLEMTTVAEGVETEDHLARVEAAGCDAVQGYLFSRPVPAGDLADVVAEIDQRLASGRVKAA